MIHINEIKKLFKSDIKEIVFYKNMMITAGRDGMLKLEIINGTKSTDLNPGQGYINSLAINDEFLIGGCQNGKIFIYEVVELLKLLSNDESPNILPMELAGHTGNVCSLEISNNLILSSSWDGTAKIWDVKSKSLITEVCQSATIWCARFINDKSFVTACADSKLRIYNGEKLINTISFHTACVRSVSLCSDGIISVDNEGVVIKTDTNGNLVAHKSLNEFIYSINPNFECSEVYNTQQNELFILSGENGKVWVLDRNLTIIENILVPVTTCWKAKIEKNKIYVVGSDGRVYIYGKGVNEKAEAELEDLKKHLGGEPVKDGEFVSNGQKFKSVKGKIYQEVDGEWVLVGEGVGTQSYDNSFKVEVEGKYYTLSFNNTDNIHEVASKFIRDNHLNDEFHDDIVDFIKKNYSFPTQFKTNNTINSEGVKKNLKESNNEYTTILNNLEKIQVKDNEKIENELKKLFINGPKFIALDLYRYFISNGLSFNLSFLFTFYPSDKKEAITYIRLVSNLYCKPPFNLELLHNKMKEIRDQGIVGDETFDDYFFNREVKKK